ncbi:MAG: DUF4389 domain-containing protein [Alphaproteobacteria bacterium]|nr:DUF4389 domain-containing protein [Alphaproteobacteria bacterium]MDE2495453.1 DUF4389 domain-containing protein [Alphaproteobacteria bacterium]
MTDTSSGSGAQAVPPTGSRAPFPAVRLLCAVGFAIAAWFVFWIVVVLAVVQFAAFAVNGKVDSDIKKLSFRLVKYLLELLAFVSFLRDEQPFPIGPFPHTDDTFA